MPYLTLKQKLYNVYWHLISRYLDKRQPAADQVTLVQKLIFILPTRYGWWFILLIMLLYLLGTNYQNNLILLLCYLLLSLFLLSIVLTYHNMSGLKLQCARPAEGFAGEKITPLLSLVSEKQHLMLNFSLVQHHEQVLLTQFSAGVHLVLPTTHRGLFKLPRVKISSQYPFGLWRAWSYVALTQHYWVYPAPDSHTSPTEDAQNEEKPYQPISGGDMLSPYQSGDSIRHLVWKRLARDPLNPVVRQHYTAPQAEPSWVVIPALSGDALERALRKASHRLLTLEKTGERYGLKLAGNTLPQSNGPAHLQRCLQALAQC